MRETPPPYRRRTVHWTAVFGTVRRPGRTVTIPSTGSENVNEPDDLGLDGGFTMNARPFGLFLVFLVLPSHAPVGAPEDIVVQCVRRGASDDEQRQWEREKYPEEWCRQPSRRQERAGESNDSHIGDRMASSNSYWQAVGDRSERGQRDRRVWDSENVRASTQQRTFAPGVPRDAPGAPRWNGQIVQQKQREAKERGLLDQDLSVGSCGRAWHRIGGCGCESSRSVEALENALLISRHLFE
ncbi:hypothetical protein B0H19DRAFT_1083604 [Mycena capillaripes]|nr:hypothetical protein B0H19DRAFT_1083604 [Mycena capillaripes]